jgi:hypothetical protein
LPDSWNSFNRYHFCIYIHVNTFFAPYLCIYIPTPFPASSLLSPVPIPHFLSSPTLQNLIHPTLLYNWDYRHAPKCPNMIRPSLTFCPGWFWTKILHILTSWIDGIVAITLCLASDIEFFKIKLIVWILLSHWMY